jgi:hypothetical protein
MAVGKVLLAALVVVVMLYAFIDCVQTPRAYARSLPKWLWLLLVVLVPVVGAVAWLVLGRPQSASLVAAGARRGRGVPVAPDDDPAFLRKLADDEWSRRMRQRREGSDPDDLG